MDIVRSILGLGILVLCLYGLSENRKQINVRLVVGGLLLQLLLGVLLFQVSFLGTVLEASCGFFIELLSFADEGSAFLFGPLATDDSFARVFAVRVLPAIVFFSALSSILYYLGVLQWVVLGLAWVMSKTMKMSGAESLAVAANVFIGQTEAPLVIKPYIERMTRSEILCLMSGGMATIAGAILVIYIAILGGENMEQKLLFGQHLLTASLLSAPAAIIAAKILVPETEQIDPKLKVNKEEMGVNLFDAIIQGTTNGVMLAVNVGAVLLVFSALIAMLNFITEDWIGNFLGINALIADTTGGVYTGLTFQFILGLLFCPVAWVIGIEWENALAVGQLLGTKLFVNEFVSYLDLAKMKEAGVLTSERAVIITTYALCGFANFSSMGIQIGGISVIAPKQRENLARLAFKSLIAGTVACLMTACIAGIFV